MIKPEYINEIATNNGGFIHKWNKFKEMCAYIIKCLFTFVHIPIIIYAKNVHKRKEYRAKYIKKIKYREAWA